MFSFNFCAYGGESQESRKCVLGQDTNLHICHTVSKNFIRFKSYSWFSKQICTKFLKKSRLEKVSKQPTLDMIYETTELNQEFPKEIFFII